MSLHGTGSDPLCPLPTQSADTRNSRVGQQEIRDPPWDIIWAELLLGPAGTFPWMQGNPEAPKGLAGGQLQAGPGKNS